MDFLDEKKVGKEKLKSMDLAEDSREKEWTQPSFVAELFRGNVRWDLVFPFPKQSEEDRKLGDEYLEKIEKVLKDHIDPDEVDRTGDIPDAAVKALAEIKAFALKIPKEYGGCGFSQVNYNRICHKVASYCASTAVLLSAHQSIGVPQPLMVFGTDEQKKKFLPRFAEGSISAFALTEPDVGSDPARMVTKAVPTEDGNHYIINGQKLWCTNGLIADILIVMAETPPKVIKGKERKQITAFIVEKDTPGIENTHRCRFMGLNGIQNGLITFKDVKVPKENILLGEGKGLKLALTTLNTGRLTMPAAVTGASKLCLKISREWALKREQWGAPIGKHEAIANKIASMTTTVFAMDAVTQFASAMADAKTTDIRLEAAMAKLCCTEASWHIIDGALQIRAGRGYETGPSLEGRGEPNIPLERMMRDARINTIIEGTSQIMRLFIAREAMDTHVQKIMPIMSPKTKMGEKLGLIGKAIAHYSVWMPKQYLYKVSLPEGVEVPGRLKSHMTFIGHSAHKLARNLFIAMGMYQEKLEGKQQIMTRFVNIGADLFAMATTCSRAIQAHHEKGGDDGPLELADLFCKQARKRVKGHFQSLYSKDDRVSYDLAQKVLEEKYTWLENDIIGLKGS